MQAKAEARPGRMATASMRFSCRDQTPPKVLNAPLHQVTLPTAVMGNYAATRTDITVAVECEGRLTPSHEATLVKSKSGGYLTQRGVTLAPLLKVGQPGTCFFVLRSSPACTPGQFLTHADADKFSLPSCAFASSHVTLQSRTSRSKMVLTTQELSGKTVTRYESRGPNELTIVIRGQVRRDCATGADSGRQRGRGRERERERERHATACHNRAHARAGREVRHADACPPHPRNKDRDRRGSHCARGSAMD